MLPTPKSYTASIEVQARMAEVFTRVLLRWFTTQQTFDWFCFWFSFLSKNVVTWWMSYWLRRLRELCLWEFYPVQWTCFRNSAGFVLSLITGRVNLADTLLTSQKRWIAHAQQEFGKWSARWRLGNRFVTIWNYICHHIWNQQRLQAAHRAGICTVQEIFHELRSLKQFVICPADHHPYRAHLCCSRHFHFLLIKRFMAEIFTRCSVGWNTVFSTAHSRSSDCSTAAFAQTSCHQNAKMVPYAYILPKPSKFFESARPIISYTDSWNCRLGQVVGGIVLQLCRSLFHNISLDQDVIQIMEAIHSVFYRSAKWSPSSAWPARSFRFFQSCLQLQDQESCRRIFRGRYRRAGSRVVQIKGQHIPDMISFLLRHSYFMVGRHLFKQVRGASMGSQFAPALCRLVAACQEYIFTKTFEDLISANRLLCNARYVDNRAMIGIGSWRKAPVWSTFTHVEF